MSFIGLEVSISGLGVEVDGGGRGVGGEGGAEKKSLDFSVHRAYRSICKSLSYLSLC